MWPFTRKKSLLEAGVLRGWTDWHCHILPGVDDGIPTLEDSLAALRWYEAQGVEEVWLTPHVMEDIPNTPAQLRARFAELCSAYASCPATTGHLTLHLAAEHMLDPLFEERLEAGELLPMGETLLVETSYFNPPLDLDGMLKAIRKKGFQPLLAHPERYVYMDWRDYARLQDELGVAFQLNLPSLAGAYGPEVRKKAERLLAEGRYCRTGSDLHRLAAFRRAMETKINPDLITTFLH